MSFFFRYPFDSEKEPHQLSVMWAKHCRMWNLDTEYDNIVSTYATCTYHHLLVLL